MKIVLQYLGVCCLDIIGRDGVFASAGHDLSDGTEGYWTLGVGFVDGGFCWVCFAEAAIPVLLAAEVENHEFVYGGEF